MSANLLHYLLLGCGLLAAVVALRRPRLQPELQLFAAATGLASAIARFGRVTEFDAFYFRWQLAEPWAWPVVIFGCWLPTLLLGIWLGHRAGPRKGELAAAVAPLSLLLFPAALPFSPWTLLAGLFLVSGAGWKVLRFLPDPPPVPARLAGAAVWLAAAAAVLRGCWLQLRALESNFLLYQDWGEYLQAYLTTPFGPGWLVLGGHWNPAVNPLLILLCRCFPEPLTLFALHAIVIYAAAPLLYALARRRGLSPGIAAGIGLLYVLNPVVGNLPNSLFYSYHPIVFLLPLLPAFLLAREQRSRWGMALLFVLSLGLQETVFLFWCGYALLLAIRRRWKSALLLGAGSLGGFLLITLVVIPLCAGVSAYPQFGNHYARFGASLPELLAAPIARAGDFWGALFAAGNLRLLLILLLPCWLPALRAGLWLLPALPITLAVWLKGGLEVQSPHSWYHLELLAMLFAATIFGTAKFRRPGPVVGAMLIATLLAGSYFGTLLPWSCNAQCQLTSRRDRTPLLAELERELPPGATLRATPRLRARLFLKHPTVDYHAPVAADFVVLDLADGAVYAEALKMVRRELADPAGYTLVRFWQEPGSRILLFRRGGGPPPPFLTTSEASGFERWGVPLPATDPAFSARALPVGREVQFLVRLEHPIDTGAALKVALYRGGETRHFQLEFGYGAYPAFAVPPGTVFRFSAPLPAAWPTPDGAGLRVERLCD